MVRQDFRLVHRYIRESFLKCARDLTMQLLAPSLEQTLIGSISDQRVFEAVNRLRRLAVAVHQLRLFEFGECMLQRGLVARDHSTD